MQQSLTLMLTHHVIKIISKVNYKFYLYESSQNTCSK